MPRKHRRSIFRKITFILIISSAAALLISCILLVLTLYPVAALFLENQVTPKFLFSLFSSGKPNLKSFEGRTNILFMGKAGGTHEGADLTDTMIVFSLELKNRNNIMISIPRDLWMDSFNGKINTVYQIGERQKIGGGITLVKSAVEEIISQPVHYTVILDFSSFKKIIDILGGIDVEVLNGFSDPKYPIPGKEEDLCSGDPSFSCRYQTVSFEKGPVHLDGESALKYVRSRHAEGDEGTDYARSRRQQDIVKEVMRKVSELNIVYDYRKIRYLLSIVSVSVKTDMNWSEVLSTAYLYKKSDKADVKKLVLDNGDLAGTRKGFLINPPPWKHNGVWVLEPRTGNFSEIAEYIDCKMADPNCSFAP